MESPRIEWRCPRCKGPLSAGVGLIDCLTCHAQYDVIDGIPDFRVSTDFWLDMERDRANAKVLSARFSVDGDIEGMIRRAFQLGTEADEARTALRTSQVLGAPERLMKEIDGWLDAATREAPFLDLGCGPGMLLAAAAGKGRAGIGIDASLVWLVVAKRLIAAWGGQPVLAAALAEALPLADGCVQATISLDVIEHVAEPRNFLREVNRVTRVAGSVALSTPNRFSLAAEPHVSVWGVGWVPRPWQPEFVRWRSGLSYEYTRLLSTWELSRLMRQDTNFECRIVLPKIPVEEIHRFPPYRKVLAHLYNRLCVLPFLGGLFLVFGPFFRVVGTRQGPRH